MKKWPTVSTFTNGRGEECRSGQWVLIRNMSDQHLRAALAKARKTYSKWEHEARFRTLRAYGRPTQEGLRIAANARGYCKTAAARRTALEDELKRRRFDDGVCGRRNPQLARQTMGAPI